MLLKVQRVISATLGELPIQEGGGTFKPSGHKRETKGAEVAENIDFVESPTAAELKLKLNASSSVDIQSVDVSDDTLTIFLCGGGKHVMPNAWSTEPVELGNGEYEVTFNSRKSQKLV